MHYHAYIIETYCVMESTLMDVERRLSLRPCCYEYNVNKYVFMDKVLFDDL